MTSTEPEKIGKAGNSALEQDSRFFFYFCLCVPVHGIPMDTPQTCG